MSLSAGLAFRKRFFGSDLLFFVTVASLIVPSIVTSLGIALEFRVLDDTLKAYGPDWLVGDFTTTMGQFTSGLGAHLTWTLPFGLLVMFAIFNRFDGRFEEAARDLGATPWQTLRHVVLPIILPSVIGVGLFGFQLAGLGLQRGDFVQIAPAQHVAAAVVEAVAVVFFVALAA